MCGPAFSDVQSLYLSLECVQLKMLCISAKYSTPASPSQRMRCTWCYVHRGGKEDLLEDYAAGGLKSEERAYC